MYRKLTLMALLSIACLFASVMGSAAQGRVQVDPALPSYQPVSGILGNLISVGSDSMINLMTLWAEEFRRYYPSVQVEIEGKGSSTAPPALIAGTAQFGPMSRDMRSTEIDAFESVYGYKPTGLAVGLDALAVYVHKDNPITSLSMEQLDAIFSSTRRCGYPETIVTWGAAGLGGAWENRPISLYGRNSASGTYGFFKDNALCGGDFKNEVKEQPGSAAVVQGVTVDRYGIGYSGLGYRTSGVKALQISYTQGETPVEPNLESVLSGDYPLARFLLVYINKNPNEPLSPLVREFVKFIYSKEGQEAVVRDGYLPLSADGAAAELEKVLN